jgi:Tfp pilus assembly protein PilP
MCRNVRLFQKLLSTGVISILVGIFLLSFIGCEQAPPPSSSPSKVEKTEPPPPTEKQEEKVAEVEPTPTYYYDATGRREPFQSLLQEELQPKDPLLPPEPGEESTPLQKFELNQLKITGILLGGLGDYARLSAPDGKSYTISVGTPIGNQEGKVISISDNLVLVKEIFRYASGKIEEVETPMYLNPIKEGEKR